MSKKSNVIVIADLRKESGISMDPGQYKAYVPSTTYNKGDRIRVVDSGTGDVTIMRAKEDGITGPYDASKWEAEATFPKNAPPENHTPALTAEQMMMLAMFGGSSEMPQAYSESKTYRKGEKILYTDPATGVTTIRYAKESGITGPFNASKWKIFNLMAGTIGDGSSGGGGSKSMSETNIVAMLLKL